ncbi:hypothetical protein [Hymenobacter psychrophilus]|uniref:Uncharacterized protein n=1 Tax=Hymenobacter psychrophilus TaxID=651662 RepID=A0A1H3LUG8_9BACT|nr:hypothetical protein [Hymenobacter psychrophilus]SDY67993.1 hypothetical protein SAMN04488069_111137 [Hymenobacter psychrophilus]
MPTPHHALVGPAAYEPAPRSILRIQKARVKHQQLQCEFTEQRTDQAPTRIFALTCQELVHPDLLARLAQLVPHLCLLCEQLRETPDFWPDDDTSPLPDHLAPFTVTGFTLGGGGSGVTLLGQRQLAGGKLLNLTSPYVAFDQELEPYAYAGLLETAVQAAVAEVEEALRGKCTADSQLDLFEPAAGFTAIDEPFVPLIPMPAHA